MEGPSESWWRERLPLPQRSFSLPLHPQLTELSTRQRSCPQLLPSTSSQIPCEANSSSSVLLQILLLSCHVLVFEYLEMLIRPTSLCRILPAYFVDSKSDMMSVSLEKKFHDASAVPGPKEADLRELHSIILTYKNFHISLGRTFPFLICALTNFFFF